MPVLVGGPASNLAIWVGTWALLDPINWHFGRPSIVGDWFEGRWGRTLALGGAFAFTVPSAFTVPTGEAHWHVLLRARAVENGAFVIAPAQGGLHANGRHTYGHSLIIDPWGEILAEAGTEPGVIYADIDPALSAAARAKIPNLQHGRDFTGP